MSTELMSIANFKTLQTVSDSFLKSGFLPAHFRNINQVTFIMQIARDLGVSETMALQNTAFIKGKVSFSGQMILSMVFSSGKMRTWNVIERSDSKCIIESERTNGAKLKVTFGMEDAQRAGLVSDGSGYKKYPKQMLYWRAVTDLSRSLYPDVVFGMYTPEELESNLPEIEAIEGVEASDIIDVSSEEVKQVESGEVKDEPVMDEAQKKKKEETEKKRKNLFFFKMSKCKYSIEEVKKECVFEHVAELVKDPDKFKLVVEFIDKNQKETT